MEILPKTNNNEKPFAKRFQLIEVRMTSNCFNEYNRIDHNQHFAHFPHIGWYFMIMHMKQHTKTAFIFLRHISHNCS